MRFHTHRNLIFNVLVHLLIELRFNYRFLAFSARAVYWRDALDCIAAHGGGDFC